MDDRRTVETLIENSLRKFAALGIQRQPDDLEAFMRYRDGLAPEERRRFDDLLKAGAFPASAAESVEIVSGRLKSQGAQEETTAPEVNVHI